MYSVHVSCYRYVHVELVHVYGVYAGGMCMCRRPRVGWFLWDYYNVNHNSAFLVHNTSIVYYVDTYMYMYMYIYCTCI